MTGPARPGPAGGWRYNLLRTRLCMKELSFGLRGGECSSSLCRSQNPSRSILQNAVECSTDYTPTDTQNMAGPHRAVLSGHCCNLKGLILLCKAESKVVLVQGPQRQWLHLPAAQCTAEGRKPSDACSRQPGALPHKQWDQDISSRKGASSGAKSQGTPAGKKEEPDPLQDKSISLYQSFKKIFRQYGKVLIPVHLITSGVWFGPFYYAAIKGVNVFPFLELMGLPNSILSILKYLCQSGCTATPPRVKEYLQDRMEETKDRLTEKLQETKEKVSFKKKVE